MSGMVEARVIKFCTQVGCIKTDYSLMDVVRVT